MKTTIQMLNAELRDFEQQLETLRKDLQPGPRIRLNLPNIGPTPPGTVVNVTAMIDPPTASRPGGEVWESDETDNLAQDAVFVLAQSFEEPPLGADFAPPKP